MTGLWNQIYSVLDILAVGQDIYSFTLNSTCVKLSVLNGTPYTSQYNQVIPLLAFIFVITDTGSVLPVVTTTSILYTAK